MLNTILLSSLPTAALLVITAQSPIISVLALIVFTTLMASLLFLQQFTFVSLLYVVVYVGAVAILFLFVIMIIDVREADITHTGKSYTKNIPLSFLIATLGFTTLIAAVQERSTLLSTPITNSFSRIYISDIQALAEALYGYSAFNLIILSIILLTAIIGPITLCLLTKN